MNSNPTLLLVRHASTSATRTFRFPADEPLDEIGRHEAARLADLLFADRSVSSPAMRCRSTAKLAGFTRHEIDPDLAELDFGEWAGRDAMEVGRTDRERLDGWYADPLQAPPGGESLSELAVRVTTALERQRDRNGRTVVFTHGGPIKVAILSALSAPLSSIWRLDIAPCSVTELQSRPDGGWTVTTASAAVLRPARTANMSPHVLGADS